MVSTETIREATVITTEALFRGGDCLHLATAEAIYIYIYRMVGRSTADISNPRSHIYQGAKRRVKYSAEIRYDTIYDASYGECATDKPLALHG